MSILEATYPPWASTVVSGETPPLTYEILKKAFEECESMVEERQGLVFPFELWSMLKPWEVRAVLRSTPCLVSAKTYWEIIHPVYVQDHLLRVLRDILRQRRGAP